MNLGVLTSADLSIRRSRPLVAFGVVFVVWLLLRILFFEGCFWLNDDWFQVRYAYLWTGPPANIYDARLLFNGLLRASLHVFGYRPLAWALPGLVGSLLMTAAGFELARRTIGSSGAVAAGLITASLPIDILLCTVPLALSLSVGLFAIAVLLLTSSPRRVGLVGAILAAALSELAHPVAVFHVLALSVAVLLFGHRRRALVFGGGSVALYFCLELAVSTAATGNPLHNLVILRAWHDPDGLVVLFSQRWFTKPFTDLLFSKMFGFVFPVIALALLLIPELRRSKLYLILASYCFGGWLWFSFGTAKPTIYEPFWRDPRFLHPMGSSIGVLVALIVSCRPRWRTAILVVLCSVNILLVTSSGTWGQSKNISLEMLHFVQSNPEARFFSDLVTYRQRSAGNQFRELANVCVMPCPAAVSGTQRVFLLYNPLNQPAWTPNRPPPVSLGLDQLRCATPVLITQPKPRLIVAWLPFSIWSRYPALIRQPAGYIRPVLSAGAAGQRCDAY
jgi:hypothetical protein